MVHSHAGKGSFGAMMRDPKVADPLLGKAFGDKMRDAKEERKLLVGNKVSTPLRDHSILVD